MKVFCEECRHFWQMNRYADQCKHPKNIKEEVTLDSHKRKGGNSYTLYPTFPPHELNSDNNCSWFEYKQPPWWVICWGNNIHPMTVIFVIFFELLTIAFLTIGHL